MRTDRVIAVVLLVFWVLAGPLAAAFGSCAAGAACEGPCCIASCPAQVDPNELVAPLVAVAMVTPAIAAGPPNLFRPVLKPPPKSRLAV